MKQRAYVAAVLGGLALLVVVGVVVLQFGRHNPSPPRLEENPNTAIPGELIWFNERGCIMRGAASGATRAEVYCSRQPQGVASRHRIDVRTAAFVEWAGPTSQLVTVDLETREATFAPFDPRDGPKFSPWSTPVAPDGTGADIDESGRVVIVAGGFRTQIADFDVAKYAQPQVAAWSPDSQWLVLSYYNRRGNGDAEIWIISRDGRVQGTLAKRVRGAESVSWWIDGLAPTPPRP